MGIGEEPENMDEGGGMEKQEKEKQELSFFVGLLAFRSPPLCRE